MEVDKGLTEFLDGRYVKKDDCNSRHEETVKEISELKISSAKTNTLLSVLVKICSFIAATAGGILIKEFCELIVK